MKRIALSLVTVFAVVAMVAGATQAVFSDTGYILGNTMSSGTVDLTVHNFSGNKPIHTSLMVPGQWTPDGRAELYNTGTLPVKVYMYVQNLTGTCDKTNLKVETGNAGGNEHLRAIYNGALAALDGSGARVEVTGNPPFATLGANWSQVIHQLAQLDPSADNSYQGKSCTWDEVFVAENVAP